MTVDRIARAPTLRNGDVPELSRELGDIRRAINSLVGEETDIADLTEVNNRLASLLQALADTYANLPNLASDATAEDVLIVDSTGSFVEYKRQAALKAGAVRATRNGTNQTIATGLGSWKVVEFDAETFDPEGYHDPATNPERLTVPTGHAGVFLLETTLVWAASGSGDRHARIRYHDTSAATDTTIDLNVEIPASATVNPYQDFSTVWEADDGDFFQVEVMQDSGGDLDLVFNTDYSPTFSLLRAGASG